MNFWATVLLPHMFYAYCAAGDASVDLKETNIPSSTLSEESERVSAPLGAIRRMEKFMEKIESKKQQRPVINSDVLVDELEYDDFEDYDIEEIRRYSEKPLEEREYEFTDEDKKQFVDYHNAYRSNMSSKPIPESSNMHFMEWDNVMEWQAKEWSDMCVWHKHGNPPSQNSSYSQNLYFGKSNTPSRSLWLWYIEWKYYDFDKMECALDNPTPKYTCGHFTCMMWHESLYVGCARQICRPRDNNFILCCHYIPGGNIMDELPFLKGRPCNQCLQTGNGLCWKNLCVNERQCRDYKLEGCYCNQQCENCGVLDPKTCTCSCRDGWDGIACTKPCENEHWECTPKKIYIPIGCTMKWKNGEVMLIHCRALCKTCLLVDPQKTYALCCAGKYCPSGYILNETDCSCVVECPGVLCTYGTTEAESPLQTMFPFQTMSLLRTIWPLETITPPPLRSGCTKLKFGNVIHLFSLILLYVVRLVIPTGVINYECFAL